MFLGGISDNLCLYIFSSGLVSFQGGDSFTFQGAGGIQVCLSVCSWVRAGRGQHEAPLFLVQHSSSQLSPVSPTPEFPCSPSFYAVLLRCFWGEEGAAAQWSAEGIRNSNCCFLQISMSSLVWSSVGSPTFRVSHHLQFLRFSIVLCDGLVCVCFFPYW